MPRRKNDRFFDDLYTIFMKVPPWVCLPLAVVVFFCVSGVFPHNPASKARNPVWAHSSVAFWRW
jgi:hypothetical protein